MSTPTPHTTANREKQNALVSAMFRYGRLPTSPAMFCPFNGFDTMTFSLSLTTLRFRDFGNVLPQPNQPTAQTTTHTFSSELKDSVCNLRLGGFNFKVFNPSTPSTLSQVENEPNFNTRSGIVCIQEQQYWSTSMVTLTLTIYFYLCGCP